MSKTPFVMPSAEKDRKAIQGAIREICDHFTIMAAANDAVKDICEMLKDEFSMEPAQAKSIGRIMLKQNFDEIQAKFEELEEIAQLVLSK